MKVIIRLSTPHDFEDIISLEEKCFEFPLLAEEFVYFFSRSNIFCIVCEHKERIVGMLLYEVRKRHVALICIAIDPKYQRKGIGTKMMQSWLKAMKFMKPKVSLLVRAKNLPAQMFFKSLGFKATAIIQDAYEAVSEDGYLMEQNNRSCDEFESAMC